MSYPLFRIIGVLIFLFPAYCFCQSLSNEELVIIRDGFETRRDAYLKEYLDRPFFEIDPALLENSKHIKHANWIWYPGENALQKAPVGTRFFKKEFNVPYEHSETKAYCSFAADNYADLHINGQRIGRANGFHRASVFEISKWIRPGRNIFTMEVHNGGAESNPAGVLGVITLQFRNQQSRQIITDESWQSSQVEAEGRNIWKNVEVLGQEGILPWREVSIRLDVSLNQYVFSRLTFALAALSLQTQMDIANQKILEAIERIHQTNLSIGEFGLHWMGGIFYRIYGQFGPRATIEERLEKDTSAAILDLFSEWAKSQSRIDDVEPIQTWQIWGSENHSAQRDATLWATAKMINDSPQNDSFQYDDGSTSDEQLASREAWLKEYFRERVKRGMLIEISPSGYGSRTMQGWHNIYDFTDDPELKSLAKAALDVWWTEWAQEQLGGMRGGGKSRLYPGVYALSNSDRNRAMSWFYLGQGWPAHHHETLPVIASTTYRLPLVVMDIALHPYERGVYECQSRRLGRRIQSEESKSRSTPETPVYMVDPHYGGIVKYSYCTPGFIMGTLMLENRPTSYWTNISQQNRWHGVIFSGQRDSTIYPRCATDKSTYNEQWSIQNKGTLITQKLRNSDSAKEMRVCFSEDLQPIEKHGWIFAQAERAFAAVKIVQGGWRWEDDIWLVCNEEYTPIIFEVVHSQDFDMNFNSFQTAISEQEVTLMDGVLTYQGLQNTGNFTFYPESEQTPELNGKPINFAPDFAFESPFLKEDWGSGVVRIQKGRRNYIVDVRENGF